MNKPLLIATLAAVFTGPALANEPSSMTLAMNDIAPKTWVQPVALDLKVEDAAEKRMASALEETNKQLNERMTEQFEQDLTVPTL